MMIYEKIKKSAGEAKFAKEASTEKHLKEALSGTMKKKNEDQDIMLF